MISAALAVWKRAEALAKALDALNAQTVRPEIVVVEDYDNSPEVGQVVSQKGVDRYYAFPQRTRLRLAQIFNRSIEMCTGDIVFKTGCDIIAPPDFCERAEARLRELGEDVMLIPHIENVGLNADIWKSVMPKHRGFCNWRFADTSALLFFKSRYLPFNPDMDVFYGGDSVEWAFRTGRSGVRFYYEPDLVVTHINHTFPPEHPKAGLGRIMLEQRVDQ